MRTHPLTMGQLSMLRDLRVRQPAQLWESNLDVAWPAPPGTSVDQVRQAFLALAARHESLRTVYRTTPDPRRTRQLVLPEPRVRFGPRDVREPFDLTARPAWQAWVDTGSDTDTGVPRAHLVIHHLVADGAALRVLESDFHDLLHGVPPGAPAPTPGALAESQRTDPLRARLAAAAEHLTRTVETAPPAEAVSRGPLVRACAHTGIPYALAQRAARELRVTVANLLFSAYAAAIAATTGTERHLLWQMSANRLAPASRRLVSSMTQWVPVVVRCAPDAEVEAVAPAVNVAALTALQHGVYDPFAVPPLDFDRGCFFTFVPPPDTAGAATLESPRLERLTPRGYSGASFYLIAHAHPRVRLTLRVMRDGYGHREVERFLTTMTRLLRRVVEEPTVRATA